MIRLVVIAFVPLVMVTVTSSAIQEQKKRLTRSLFKNDMSDVVPRVYRLSVLAVGVDFLQFVHHEFDEFSREFDMEFGIRLRWTDLRLRWKPHDFGGVTNLTGDEFDTNRIWQPTTELNGGNEHFKCSLFEVHSSGNVTCISSVHLRTLCIIRNFEDFPVNSFICTTRLNTHGVISNCDGKGKYCLRTSRSDHMWQYDLSIEHPVTHFARREWNRHRSHFTIDFELTRIRPHTKIVYSLIILLGCVILLQWLLQVDFQERIFLNAAFTVASNMVIISLHTYSTVVDGGGGKVLRLSATVTFFNCAVMVVTVLSANFLHSISAKFDLNAKVNSFFHRMKMSIFLPTVGGLPSGDDDQWISLSITINRLLFVLFCFAFIIIVLVP